MIARSVGSDDATARANGAADWLAHPFDRVGRRLDRLHADLRVLKWMVAVNFALTLVILVAL